MPCPRHPELAGRGQCIKRPQLSPGTRGPGKLHKGCGSCNVQLESWPGLPHETPEMGGCGSRCLLIAALTHWVQRLEDRMKPSNAPMRIPLKVLLVRAMESLTIAIMPCPRLTIRAGNLFLVYKRRGVTNDLIERAAAKLDLRVAVVQLRTPSFPRQGVARILR